MECLRRPVGLAGSPLERDPADRGAPRRDRRRPGDARLYLALGANRSTPAARLVFDLLDRNPETFGPGESFWDSLTSMVAFEPSLASFQPVGLHVELAEDRNAVDSSSTNTG